MSLLTIITGVCDIVGLARPSSVVSGANQTTRTLLTLAQTEGKELASRHSWQALQTDHTFTSVATEAQTGAIPSDFDRWVDDTFWNRSLRRPVKGPLSAEQWAVLKATSVPAVSDVFRERGDTILILPVPAAGQTYAYTYVSKNWCRSNTSTAQAAWAADTDTGVLDEELHKLGIVWRYLKARGMDYADDMATYERAVARAIGKDGGKTKLCFGASYDWRPSIGIPEGDWNL